MTHQPFHNDFVEQAAERLSETDGHLAARLLRRPRVRRDPASPPHRWDDTDQATPDHRSGVEAATLKSAGMIDWASNHGRLSEEFRMAQGQLLQGLTAAKASQPGNVVMVTSSKPGEGKTFASLNLAGSLAFCSQKTVILVDWDVRRPTLSQELGLTGHPGLLNLLDEPHLALGGLLVTTSLPTLHVLPAGQRERHGPTSHGQPAAEVIERLVARYPDGIILLDTPSCLSSSEPSRLASVARTTVLVVQAQQTQAAEVEAALDLVEACPSIMLLLNKLQITGSDTFGAYDTDSRHC